jgi:hypothetical protein
MITPTTAYHGLPALTAGEAAEWMVTAVRRRPVRIAPRIALFAKALDTVSPQTVNAMRQRVQSSE